MAQQQWQMPRPQFECAATGRTFEVGEAFRAYLYETDDGYARRDYALDCSPDDADEALASWITRRPAPTDPKPKQLDAATILEIFRNLADRDDVRQRQFRFILGLLLWRRKVLKLVGTEDRPDDEVWIYTAAKDDEDRHFVRRPQLSDAEMETLSRQIEALLYAGELGALETAEDAGLVDAVAEEAAEAGDGHEQESRVDAEASAPRGTS